GFQLIRDGFVDLDSWAPDHMPELQLAGRLPLRARPHGRRLRQPVARVQTSRMALVDELALSEYHREVPRTSSIVPSTAFTTSAHHRQGRAVRRRAGNVAQDPGGRSGIPMENSG